MSVELKFRAWDKKESKWLFGYEYPNLGGFSLIGETVLMGEFSSLPLEKLINDVVIMQYTGLKDKDGKEIYEGDILSASRTVTGVPLPNGKIAEIFGNVSTETRTWDEVLIAEIKVNNNSISFELPEEGGTYQERGIKLKWIIIGNVYENPDLIPKT
jgi:uncharacterized phage protein (TIGR01671 family)